MRFCCSRSDRFLLLEVELKDTRFAKLSPVDVAGFAGELERFEAADNGVDRPEAPFGRTFGNIKPEPIGGGLFVGAFESEVQLSPFKSSMVGRHVGSLKGRGSEGMSGGG